MRCIYADPDNRNKFNTSDSGLLAQMYLQLSKSGCSTLATLGARLVMHPQLPHTMRRKSWYLRF